MLYLDRIECVGTYDIHEIYNFLDIFAGRLEAERKKYVHKLSIADVKKRMLEESAQYHMVITFLVQAALIQAVQIPILLMPTKFIRKSPSYFVNKSLKEMSN